MNCGAYQLLIRIEETVSIEIGALGQFDFPAGFYLYTGSALKNLSQRVGRHRRHDKKQHWHIDYLLANKNARIVELKLFPSEIKIECELNQKALDLPGAYVPVRGFGSSDCRQCPAHLIGLGKSLPKNIWSTQ